jgi:hypothetical protein
VVIKATARTSGFIARMLVRKRYPRHLDFVAQDAGVLTALERVAYLPTTVVLRVALIAALATSCGRASSPRITSSKGASRASTRTRAPGPGKWYRIPVTRPKIVS